MTDAERIRWWFKVAGAGEDYHAIHLRDAALRCEQLSQELALAKASLGEWLDGFRIVPHGHATLLEHDVAQRIRRILSEEEGRP